MGKFNLPYIIEINFNIGGNTLDVGHFEPFLCIFCPFEPFLGIFRPKLVMGICIFVTFPVFLTLLLYHCNYQFLFQLFVNYFETTIGFNYLTIILCLPKVNVNVDSMVGNGGQ